jgi:hypothetical protein
MSDDAVLDEYRRLLRAAERDLLPASQARLRGAAEQTREATEKLATLRPPSTTHLTEACHFLYVDLDSQRHL